MINKKRLKASIMHRRGARSTQELCSYGSPEASYGVHDPTFAVTQLAQTSMRSEIGKMTLDRTFEVPRRAVLGGLGLRELGAKGSA